MLENQLNPQSAPGTSIPHKQENTRAWIAKCLTGLFCVIILAVLGYFIFGNPDNLKSTIILSIVSAVSGILGTAIGFYFGQNSNQE